MSSALSSKLKHLLAFLVSLLFILPALGVFDFSLLSRLENDAYGARLAYTMPEGKDERIVILDIDEKSLAAEGRWPWGRDKLAHIITQLFDHYQINTLGFDVVFAEPDSTGQALLSMLPESIDPAVRTDLTEKLDHDGDFARALKGKNVVLGYYFKELADGQVNVGKLPSAAFPGFAFEQPLPVRTATGYGANLAIFQKATKQGGHFNPQVDEDGIVRKVAMLIGYEGNYYASLSLAIAKAYLKQPVETVFAQGLGVSEGYVGLERLSLGDKMIPVDQQVRALIPYRGKSYSFPYISATDVLTGKTSIEALHDKIVIVGTTAPGLLDLRATPVEAVYPGVEIHANLVAGILDGVIKERPAWAGGAELVILMLITVLMIVFLPASPLWSSMMTLVLAGLIMTGNLWLWQSEQLVLNLAQPITLLLSLYFFYMVYGFFIESRNKQLLSQRFGQYVPPELVDEMAANPDHYNFEGESKTLTVLFSDVRGFTSISEKLQAKELADLMNAYLTPMTHVIHEYRGTIDKYMGDAIMAFWGAPIKDDNHASHAIACSLDMLKRLKLVNEDFAKRGWPPIKIGIGLNSGTMTVGNMGSEFRMAYTVMGDEVNLGSRLEGITKSYGVMFIVSENTKALAPEYTYRELDRVRVKGKDLPITIYEPIGLTADLSLDELDMLSRFEEALHEYRLQSWLSAQEKLQNLANLEPDRYIYPLYLERIEHYIANPPPENWDGVYTFTTK